MLNIFLDLEETVIDSWADNPTFLPQKCDDIKRFLDAMKLLHPRLFIFSMAVHSDEDAELFHANMSASLLKLIDMPKIDGVVTVPEMQEASEKINKMRFFDVTDFICLRGKELAFHDWCHFQHPGEMSFLIDDVVPNRTIHDHDNGSVLQTINVRDIFTRRPVGGNFRI